MRHKRSIGTIRQFIRERARAWNCVNIIPKPQDVQVWSGYFVFSDCLKFDVKSSEAETACGHLKSYLENLGAESSDSADQVIEFVEADMAKEAYAINVDSHKIQIKACDSSGFLYAVYSIKQLIPVGIREVKRVVIPLLTLNDFPRFPWRSFTLDCSRQFFSVETLKRLFEQLSFYKINVFHWHLCDDEGWRLEIDAFPDLTHKGAWRGPNEILPPDRGSGQKRYGGFYSKDEVRELISYADKLGIEIIPEIDIPGHALAIVNSYPETRCSPVSQQLLDKGVKLNTICPSRKENLDFLKQVLTEVSELFPSQYIHIGNDEVERAHWDNCESCQKAIATNHFNSSRQLQDHFFRQVHQIVKALGKEVVAWNESLADPNLPQDTTIMSWEGVDPAKDALAREIPVILCPGPYCYIDMAQGPFERGHSWAGFLDMEKVYSYEPLKDLNNTALVKGYGICLWAEYLDQKDFIWEQIFPRLLAASELAWSSEKNWPNLMKRYKNYHCHDLKSKSFPSRINKPQIVYKNKMVSLIKQDPNDQVYFSTDGSTPTQLSKVYTVPISTDELNDFKARLLSPCGSWSSVSRVPNFDDIQESQYSHYPYQIKTYRKARYQEPESNAGKGNRELYVWVPTPYMPGGFIDFIFEEPLKASHLEIRSGVPKTLRSLVEEADLLYSSDGSDFHKISDFVDGISKVNIQELSIKKLRILFTKEQSEWTAIQELLIKA